MKGIDLLILLLLFLCSNHLVLGQEEGSSSVMQVNSMAVLASGELSDQEMERMTENLQDLAAHPVYINGDRMGELADAGLITALQLNRLREYRYKFGDILSFNELYAIDGWDEQSCLRILSFITLVSGPPPIRQMITKKRKLHQSLMMMAGRTIEKSAGYLAKTDEENPMVSYYHGSAWKSSLRYDLDYGSLISFGIRSEKDPGEPFFPYHNEYPVRFNYPDYLSACLVIRPGRTLQEVILGDYHVRFGYGITISTGGGFSYWKDPFSRSGTNRTLRQNTSMAESGALRGAAVNLAIASLSFQAFYSSRKLDPSGLAWEEDGTATFTSFNETGYHRTDQEMERRGLLSETTFGALVSMANRWLRTGVACVYSGLSMKKQAINKAYAAFGFGGNKNTTLGAFLEAYLGKTVGFVEFSYAQNNSLAYIAGMRTALSPALRLSLDYRHFPVRFQPGFHSRGAGPYGSLSNESGLSVGLQLDITGKWSAAVVMDIAEMAFISYDADLPGRKYACHLRLTRDLYKSSLLMAYTYKQGLGNDGGSFHYLSPISSIPKHQADLQWMLSTEDRLRYKTRISLVVTGENPGKTTKGVAMQQEISFLPGTEGLKITLGAVLFHSGDYNSRLYIYEPDILYTSGNQMLYGRGVRSFLLLKYSFWDHFDAWLKAGMVLYRDRTSIGSGLDEIDGNKKSSVSLQVRISL